MKTIFKFATVLAVAGAALLSVGCVKDYSEDIQGVKKELSDLKEGTIATQTQQIANLSNEVKALQAMDVTLKGLIDATQKALDDAKADLQKQIDAKPTSAAVEALQGRVATLESQVSALNVKAQKNADNIETIQDQITNLQNNKADKDFVANTYATKDALNGVQSTLGALSTTVEQNKKALDDEDVRLQAAIDQLRTDAEGGDKKLQKQIDDLEKNYKAADTKIQNQLDEVSKVANNAKALADSALGQVAQIWQNFDNYYKKGEVDEKIKTLDDKLATLEGNLNSEIENRKSADTDIMIELNKAHKALKDSIDSEAARLQRAFEAADGAIKDTIKAKIAKLEEDYKAADAQLRNDFEAADAALKDSLDTKIADLQGQINTINQEITGLKEKDQELERKINSLNIKLDEEIANRQADSALFQGKFYLIDSLYKAADKVLGQRIDSLNISVSEETARAKVVEDTLATRIANLKSALETETQNREDAEAALRQSIEQEMAARESNDSVLLEKIEANTLALIDSVAKIRLTIDGLNVRIAQNEQEIENIYTQLSALDESIEAESKRIDTLRMDVDNHYSELKGLIAENGEAILANAQRLAIVADSVAANDAKIKELKVALDDKTSNLQQQIDDLQIGISPLFDTLQTQIAVLDEKITTEINKLNEKLSSDIKKVASRVTSISVLPTINSELRFIELADTAVSMLRVSFQIEPASAVDSLNKENLKLIYTPGLKREFLLKDVEKSLDADIVNIAKNENGQITVTAKVNVTRARNLTKLSYDAMGVYFALSYSNNDGISNYTVTSDYAVAVVDYEARDIQEFFRFVKPDGTVLAGNDTVAPTQFFNYVEAKDTSVQPFTGYSVIYENSKDVYGVLPKGNWTFAQLDSLIGLKVKASVDTVVNRPLEMDTTAFNAKVSFSQELNLFDYVDSTKKDDQKKYEAKLEMSLKTHDRAIKPGKSLSAFYKLTRVENDTVAIPAITLHWNWLNWNCSQRMDSLKLVDFGAAKSLYEAAREHGAKAKSQVTFGGATTNQFTFGKWNFDDYGDTLTVKAIYNLSASPKTYKDTIYKSCESDDYAFAVEVKVDSAIVTEQTKLFNVNVDGSLTKSTEFTVNNFFAAAVKNAQGKIFPELISGLSGADTVAATIVAKAKDWAMYHTDFASVKLNGVALKLDTVSFVGDQLKFSYIPGYNKKDTLTVSYMLFGYKYTATIVINVGAPKFSLATHPLIQNGIGYVRGSLQGDVYTMNTLNYYNQVYVKDQTKANEEVGSNFVVKFNVKIDSVTYASGNLVNDGQSGVTSTVLSGSNGTLDPNFNPLGWGNYSGQKVRVTATLYVEDKEFDSVSYDLVTNCPVLFESVSDISAIKKADTPLPINFTEKAVVYGFNDGVLQTSKNLVASGGSIKSTPQYGASGYTKFVFDSLKVATNPGATPDSIKATINGVPYMLNKGVDYTWADDTNVLYLTSDNITGGLEFDMDVYLRYYLDYDAKKMQKKTVHVSVKPNSFN